MQVNTSDLLEMTAGHTRCDGTCNVLVELKNGDTFHVYGLTSAEATVLMTWLDYDNLVATIDDRFLSLTDELYNSQNGIATQRGA